MGTPKKKDKTGKQSKKTIRRSLEVKLKDLVIDLNGDRVKKKVQKQIKRAAKILSKGIDGQASLKVAAQKPVAKKKDLPVVDPVELAPTN
jgi:hypothetical protein